MKKTENIFEKTQACNKNFNKIVFIYFGFIKYKILFCYIFLIYQRRNLTYFQKYRIIYFYNGFRLLQTTCITSLT
jgi:hypothetical protein